MTSNRQTQIFPPDHSLDPLGSYYQYYMKYRGMAGAVNGEHVDPHLQAYSVRTESTPDVVWNLGGRLVNDQVTFPNSTQSSFENFVRSTTQSGANLADAQENFSENPGSLYEEYVMQDREGQGEAATWTSFPNQLASVLLLSATRIINEINEGVQAFGAAFPLGDIDPQVYELNPLQQYLRNLPANSVVVRRFVNRFHAILPDQFRNDLFDRFNGNIHNGQQRKVYDGVFEHGRVTANFLDILHYYRIGEAVTDHLSGDLNQYSTDGESLVVQMYDFRLTQALLPEIPGAIVKEILRHVTMPKNNCIRYRSASAFVKTVNTYREWDYSCRGSAADYVRPRYSFYVPGYEKLISGSVGEGLPEAALPNSYIRNLYFRQPNPEYAQQIAIQATLDSKIPERSTAGLEYYTRYTEIAPTANENQVNHAAEMASLLLVPSTAITYIDSYQGAPSPMSVEVVFRRSQWDSVVENINRHGTSLPMLRFLGDFYGSPYKEANDIGNSALYGSKQALGYSSQYLAGRSGPRSMPLVTEQFDVYNAFAVFNEMTERATSFTRQFVVLSDRPAGTEVHQRFDVANGTPMEAGLRASSKTTSTYQTMLAKARRLSDRSYSRILNGEGVPSVALAYGLTKKSKDNNEIIQAIMFGNGAGTLNTSYYDTQIKYDTEYVYNLDEFSLVYNTEYSVGIVCPNYPIWLMEQYLGIGRDGYMEKWLSNSLSPAQKQPQLMFNVYVRETPNPKVVKLPIHRHSPTISTNRAGSASGLPGSQYPSTKVLDRPPSPPSLDMLPLLGVDSEIQVHVNPNAGSFLGDNALEMVPIGGQERNFAALHQYQKRFINFELPEGFLEFQPEGRREIKNIALYRTTQLDLDVENYNDLYRSFNEGLSSVLVRRYTTEPSDNLEENAGIETVGSYDILDNIRPNVNYYYACTLEDRHGHISNPSAIFRVRIVSDKGLMIPEIDNVIPNRIHPYKPLKSLTRYLQIDASNIQSFPYFEVKEDGSIISAPNIASHLGKSLEDKAFIVRLTSKDTGRIFDIKIGFNLKYGEEDEEEQDAENQNQGQPQNDGNDQGQDQEGNESEQQEEREEVDHHDWDVIQEEEQEQNEEEDEGGEQPPWEENAPPPPEED